MTDEKNPRFSQRMVGSPQIFIQTGASSPLLDIDGIRTAALSGDPDAQYQMAYAYLRGLRVEKILAQFMHWLQAAAKSGHVVAQRSLGVLYWKGLGECEVDLALARHWLGLAAAQGDPESIEKLERLENEAKSAE